MPYPAASTRIRRPGRRAGILLFSLEGRRYFLPRTRAAPIPPPLPGCPLLLRGSCPHYGHTAFRRVPVAALHGPFRFPPTRQSLS